MDKQSFIFEQAFKEGAEELDQSKLGPLLTSDMTPSAMPPLSSAASQNQRGI